MDARRQPPPAATEAAAARAVIDITETLRRREADALVERLRRSIAYREAVTLAMPPGHAKDVALGWMLASDSDRAVEGMLERVASLGGGAEAEEEILHQMAQAIGWQARKRGIEIDLLAASVETGADLADMDGDGSP